MAIPLEAACYEQNDPPKAGDDFRDAMDYWIQRAETAEAQLAIARKALEDAVETLESMDLHMDNPLYDRLRGALEPEPTK